MSKLYMFVGMPGSGKTYFYNKSDFFYDDPHLYLSTDYIIEDVACQYGMSYTEGFSNLIKFAEQVMYRNLDTLQPEENVVWDQTNLTKKSRSKKLKLIPDNYKAICFFFPTPPDWQTRLASRTGKTISDPVLKNMVENFEMPTCEEGFDIIYQVNRDFSLTLLEAKCK